MTHLAHKVRRLADSIAANMPGEQLSRNKQLAEHLANLATLLWALDDTAFAKASDWANTGIISSGGGTGSGAGPSQPTEQAALATLDHPDRLAAYDRWLRFYRGHLEDLAPSMAKILDDIAHRIGVELDHPGTLVIRDPVTGRENRVPVCAEYFCEEGAENPRRGRCDACRKWQDRWLENHPGLTLADCPVVPKDVVDARRVAKRRQKVA